jgi:flagellar biosynthesis/type III secretory pathway protein FliH
MVEKDEHFPFNDLTEINVLNLEKLPAEEDSKLVDWLRFLKAEGEEELEMAAERNPVIQEAYCKLQEMSEDEANRMLYEARLKAQRDEYSRIQGALRKGREEGWEEGRGEGREEGLEKGREEGLEKGREEERGEAVKKLLAYGMTPEQVSQALQLPPDMVRQYVK